MSPSENDLRSALHRGEGEPLDAGRIVAAGAAVRSRRRLVAATASVAAAVVLVTGGVALTRDDPTTPTAADRPQASASSASSASSPADGAAAAPAPTSGATASGAPSRTNDAASCPSSFPQRMLPGGGSPGQFGADTPLFDRTPVTITVCAYSATGTATGTAAVTGADATALRVSLESASRTVRPCPIAPTRVARSFAFVGVDASGASMRVVTTSFQDSYCNARTTNGTAVRYGWTPPESLASRLSLLGAPVASRPSPSGKNIGSPVR